MTLNATKLNIPKAPANDAVGSYTPLFGTKQVRSSNRMVKLIAANDDEELLDMTEGVGECTNDAV